MWHIQIPGTPYLRGSQVSASSVADMGSKRCSLGRDCRMLLLSYDEWKHPPLFLGSSRHGLQPGSGFVAPVCQLGTVKTALGMRVLPEIHLLLCGSARCMTQGLSNHNWQRELGIVASHHMKHDLNLAAELDMFLSSSLALMQFVAVFA